MDNANVVEGTDARVRRDLVTALNNAVRDLDYDGVIGVLAHMRADELHLASKYASSEVRAFLSRPNVFRDIYVFRVHDATFVADQAVTLQMRDLVEWAQEHSPQPVNYWQIWLAAHTAQRLFMGRQAQIDMGNRITLTVQSTLNLPAHRQAIDNASWRGYVQLQLWWRGYPGAYTVGVILEVLADYTEIVTRCTGFRDPNASTSTFAVPRPGGFIYVSDLPMFELMDGRVVSRAQNLMPHRGLRDPELVSKWHRIEDHFIARGHKANPVDVNALTRLMREGELWRSFAVNAVARVLYYTLRTRPRAMLLNRESGAPFHPDVEAIRADAEN